MLTHTGQVGVLSWWRGSSGQDAVGHLLLQPGGGDGEEDVQVLPLVLHPGLGRDGLQIITSQDRS